MVESGVLGREHFLLSCHSDCGPADQEKQRNEDFAVAWQPQELDAAGGIEWAVAMADGVSSSYFAREAAELACWIALQRLVTCDGTVSLKDGKKAVSESAVAIAQIAGTLHEDQERSCPPDEYAATWSYVLRRGRLLQTTLTLGWKKGARHVHPFVLVCVVDSA